MKIKLLMILALSATIHCSNVLAQDTKTALGYLDFVGKEFRNIQQKTWKYTSSVAHGKSARKVEKNRQEVINANKDAINKVKALPAFEGSSVFRDSAVSYLKTNYAVLNEDYGKLMNMEEIAEQSYDLMEAYMLAKEKANEKLEASGNMISEEYKTFAKSHTITLIEADDKLSKNTEIANKVYKHYNEVYLIFFKSYKQEAYMMDALSKGDVNGIEQNKNALAKVSIEGLAKLADIGPYEEDQTVITACKQLLMFYKEEAETKMTDISKFFVSKENFSKIKTSFDGKPEKERKQEDVDAYNNAVNDYNAATKNYNTTNNELNANRAKYINDWNNNCSKFTDKHVPKG